jgi:hypothetical protein
MKDPHDRPEGPPEEVRQGLVGEMRLRIALGFGESPRTVDEGIEAILNAFPPPKLIQ